MLLVAFLSASTLMAETVVVDTDKMKVAETKVILEYPKQTEKLDALARQLTSLENKLELENFSTCSYIS